MRLLVFAYHDIGYVCLEELLRAGEDVRAVITHAEDPAEEVWFRSVAELARAHGVPVYAPATVNTPEWVERLSALRPDFIFSFYYRQLLKPEVLTAAGRGALNLHGSLLPRYRGRCPVNWVLIHGETETGVTLHYMEAKADSGDIVAQRRVPIDDADTALTLYRKMTDAAALLMRETYPLLRAGSAPRLPQDHAAASYFGGRKPADGRVDWNQSARRIYNLIRAVTHPYPGAFTTWNGKPLYLWWARPCAETGPALPPGAIRNRNGRVEAGTGDGLLELLRLQLEGEAEMDAVEWLRARGAQAVECV